MPSWQVCRRARSCCAAELDAGDAGLFEAFEGIETRAIRSRAVPGGLCIGVCFAPLARFRAGRGTGGEGSVPTFGAAGMDALLTLSRPWESGMCTHLNRNRSRAVLVQSLTHSLPEACRLAVSVANPSIIPPGGGGRVGLRCAQHQPTIRTGLNRNRSRAVLVQVRINTDFRAHALCPPRPLAGEGKV